MFDYIAKARTIFDAYAKDAARADMPAIFVQIGEGEEFDYCFVERYEIQYRAKLQENSVKHSGLSVLHLHEAWLSGMTDGPPCEMPDRKDVASGILLAPDGTLTMFTAVLDKAAKVVVSTTQVVSTENQSFEGRLIPDHTKHKVH